jgi:hypothetical protein
MAASLITAFAAVTPASAAPPTDIEAAPAFQDLFWCPQVNSDRAFWTVYLSGGGSGQYKVTVSYGDGSPGSTTFHAGEYDTHHDYTCGGGGADDTYNQTWAGWRSGGGTNYDYTEVFAP